MNQPYGQRLLIHLIDERAASNHERPYAAIPRTSDVRDGFRDISYRTFANAINRAAGWLENQYGLSSTLETIVYMGSADLRYHILSLAALKTGYVMFFPSLRNTGDVLAQLFEEAHATKIITSEKPAVDVVKVVKSRHMQHVMVPDLDELLDQTPVEHIPVDATFEEWRYRPWIILHTSGSTGLPKMVPLKHGMISTVDAYHLVPESNLMPRYGNMRVFIPFPPFHIAGINFSLPVMCWVDSTVVLPPPGVPLTAELVHAVHLHGNVQHSMLAPSLIQDLTKKTEYLAGLHNLTGLTFAGGPLSKEAADLVSLKVKLGSSMGATEYGGVPMDNRKDPSEYNYFKFNEELAGIEFRESEQPALFEMVFVRRSEYPNHLVQAMFITFPELDEYHTKDCFSKHPTKPNHWKYEARLDDVIVLSNGEKINPIPMEGTITACPAVKGCLVVGQARFQTALLLEPRDYAMSRQDLVQTIEPYIQKANKVCPTYARLTMDLMFIIPEGKALPRAPKGTIQRARANTAFKDEIHYIYTSLDTVNDESSPSKSELTLDFSSRAATEDSLHAFFFKELGTSDFDDTSDLFDLGVDSLQVISLLRIINTSRPKQGKIDQMTIYENSSIAKLTAILHSGATSKGYSEFDSDDEYDKQTWTDMEALYQKMRPVSGEKQPRRRELLDRQILKSSNPPPIFQPDGGTTAWLQVLGSFLINVNNWGLINSFGIYQSYYQNTLLPSHSSFSISWIGTLQGTLLLLVGVISGPLFDRGYFHTILIMAGLGVVLGMMMLSLSTEYYQIMLSQGVLVGICLGFLYIPSVALIPLYFKRRRGLALGLTTAGGSVGGTIYPIVFRRMLVEVGFAWANRVIGFIALATLAIAVLLIKPIGARSSGVRQLYDTNALKDLPYVTMLCSGLIIFCGVLVPYFLVTDFARTVTTDDDLAFYCATILNAAQLFGRIIPSALSDFSKKTWIPGPESLLFTAQVTAGLLALCWIAVRNIGGYITWLIFYGFFSGMNVTLPAVVLPYVSPNMAVIGTRLGMLYALAGVGLLISTPIAFAANQSTGGFLGSQIWIGCCCLVGTCFFAITAFEARKRRKLYESRKLRS